MLKDAGSATTGSFQSDGVRYDSNSMSGEDMKALFESADAPADAPVTTPEPETPEGGESEASADATPADPAPKPGLETKPVEGDKTPKGKKNPQERIDRITFEREEAKRDAAKERQAREEAERRYTSEFQSLRAELEALKAPKQQDQPKPKAFAADPNEPKLADFQDQEDPYAAWMFAKWEYKQEQKELQAREAFQRQQVEQEQHAKREQEVTRIREFGQRMETHFASNPELREQLFGPHGPKLHRAGWEVIMGSQIPEQLCAYLAQNPEAEQRISAAPPLQQYRELTRIEFELEKAATTGSAAPVKPKTSAHPPVSPVSGSHAAPRSGEPGPDASYEEHAAYWNRVEAEQRRAGRR